MTRRGHNEGSIFQRQDGRWVATVNLGYEGGKRARKSFYGRTRGDVKDALAKALRDHQLGLPVARDERVTMAAFLERWLRDSAAPSTRARTLQGYTVIVRRHLEPTIGRIPLVKLGPAQVQAMLNAKTAAGLSPQSVRNIHAVLRRALNQATRWGLIPRNPATLVDTPRHVAYEAPTITPEQARAILAAMQGDRMEALVTLTLATGLRQGEALALRWSDLDLDSGSLTVRRTLQRVAGEPLWAEPKTPRSRRTVAIPASIVGVLRAHRKGQAQEQLWAGSRWHEQGLVFTSSIGTPMTGGDVTKRFQALLAAAGLPRIRFHDLRHGCASLLLAQGVHPRVVMEQLGHSTIALTMNVYSHVIPAAARDAADRMDAMLGGGAG
jgi:integrase